MDFGNMSPTEKEQTHFKFKPFENICRICLGSGELQPFRGLNVYKTFVYLYNFFDNEVNCEDQLPQNICKPCVLELENIASYILNLKNATQTLKEILQNEEDVENHEIIKKENSEEIKEQIILEFSNEDNSCIELVLDEYSTEFNSKNIFICKVCNTGFATQKSLRTHKRLHVNDENENYLNCHICDRNFTFKRSWKYHMSTHPEVTLWECSLCEWACLDENLLKEHEQNIHLKGSNIDFTCIGDKCLCNICGESFTEMGSLKDHLKIHSKVKYCKCNVCGLTFIRSSTLDKHMEVHSHEERFDCNFCAKPFTKKAFLNTHIAVFHGPAGERSPEENKPSCSKCFKKFASEKNLEKHFEKCEDEYSNDNFLCVQCGKKFTFKVNLNRHIQIVHAKRKKFICKLCGEKFTVKNSLKYHLNIHSNSKPYQCSVCAKGFRQPSALIRHKNSVHTKEKKAQCYICGKWLKTDETLRSHMKRHHLQ